MQAVILGCSGLTRELSTRLLYPGGYLKPGLAVCTVWLSERARGLRREYLRISVKLLANGTVTKEQR